MNDVYPSKPTNGVNAVLHSLLTATPNSSAAVSALLEAADRLAQIDQRHAIDLYEEAATRAAKVRDSGLLARALIGEGWLLALRGALDRALIAATRARYASDVAVSPALACDADYVIAWIHARAGDYEGAAALWRGLISAARKLNDPGREAGYYIELGNTLQFAGQHTGAVEAQLAAYDLDVRRQAREEQQAESANNAAMALLNAGRTDEALVWARRAQQLIAAPESLLARKVSHTLGLCHLRLEDFDAARQCFEQARPPAGSKAIDAHFDAELAIDLGRLHARQGHTSSAIAALEAGLAHAEALRAAHLQLSAHSELHVVYTAIGAFELALRHRDDKRKLLGEQADASHAAQSRLVRAQEHLAALRPAWQADVFATRA